MTVLKQEIPSPFATDQGKKIVKTSNKEQQVDEISQIVPTTTNATIKNGTTTSANNSSTSVATVANANVMNCHLNGNSNSSTSNELVNCLDNVAQQQPNSNDQHDERNDSNNLSMNYWYSSFLMVLKLMTKLCYLFAETGNDQKKEEQSAEGSK